MAPADRVAVIVGASSGIGAAAAHALAAAGFHVHQQTLNETRMPSGMHVREEETA